jgi:minor extracellular serine protease Vpr
MRSRFLRPLLVALALALGLAVPAAFAGDGAVFLDPLTPPPSAETGQLTAEGTNMWFVELSSAPAADGTSSSKLGAEHSAFRAAAKDAGIKYTERYSFQTLWNGFSVQAGPSQIAAISRLDGVKAVYPVGIVPMPKEDSNITPDLSTAIQMTGADIAQSEGYTGAGVKVAIMDTGVDYDHPDLGGDGTTRSNSNQFPQTGAGARVIAGTDLVGDDYNANDTDPAFQPTPHPDAYPDDCNGHGTHVAGIVGANGNPATGGARGVAPGVQFGVYRVFGCNGSTTDDVMIAAMEKALADHMDVLNMSIGDAFNNWPQSPTAAASTRLVNKGMVVVASIGNSGANGIYSAGAPGVGDKVIGVASYDNSHIHLASFTISPDDTRIGYTNAAAAPAAPTSGSLPMSRTGTPTTTNDGCTAPLSPSIAGTAVLIRRGTCTFYTKAKNAQDAGASAVVLYNNVAGRVSPTVAGSPPNTIPVVAVSDTEGVLINNRLASGPVTMTWTSGLLSVPNPTGGLISSFSSYGTTADLQLKPDIGAPGGLIRSTYPLEQGAYATISGTSMSSPHVAGTAALLLQAKPHTPSQAVRSILQNTAVPANWSGNPGLGFLDIPYRQGAGMVRIDKAIDASVTLTPGKLSLGESAAGPATRTLTLSNAGASSVTYDLSNRQAVTTAGSTFTPSFFVGANNVSYTQSGLPITSLTVPGGGTTSFEVTISPGTGSPDQGLYGGYLSLTPQGGGQALGVPYAGFIGNYQSLPVLTAAGNGLPKLARQTGFTSAGDFTPTYSFPSGTPVYTMQPSTSFGRTFTDVPLVATHLDLQAQELKAEAFRVSDGKRMGVAFDLQRLPRNATSTGFFAFGWDGKVKKGNSDVDVADGDYYLQLTLVKALGDPANPGDVETRTTGNFTIDRP